MRDNLQRWPGILCTQVCEVDTDFKRDAITHYDCKVKGVDADTCTKAGGKMEGEETDEETCAISMGGMSPLDPSSGPALDETQRKAACAKIGGTPTPVGVNCVWVPFFNLCAPDHARAA